MMKREGFTLAEVLITLGIIGVVAAMTIPTLISNTNGAQFKTGFKKALSTLNQAVLMNVALEDYDLSSLAASDDVDDRDARTLGYILTQRVQGASTIADYTYPSEIKWYYDYECTAADKTTGTAETNPCYGKDAGAEVTQTITESPTSTTYAVYQFADGTAFGYPITAENCTSLGGGTCYGFIDANGGNTANPNQVTTCTSGQEGGTGDTACQVSANGVKDIFPVYFYGQSIVPASDAARQVLFGK